MSTSRLSSFAFLTLSLIGLATGLPSLAQGRPQANEVSKPQRQDMSRAQRGAETRERSMSESVRWAQKTTGGQVLGAERVQSEGRDFNRVKLIDDRGRVRYVDDVQRRQQPQEASNAPSSNGSPRR